MERQPDTDASDAALDAQADGLEPEGPVPAKGGEESAELASVTDEPVAVTTEAQRDETPAPVNHDSVPTAAPQRIEAPATGKPRGRWWRGFTGSVAAGLAVLAVGVLGVEVVCLVTGAPGPSVLLLVGHPVAAVVALALQRVADRRYGRVAALAGLGVLLVTFVALTVFWWA
ncbi:hypothetical protein ACWEOE_06610 [Amycolatopsis sp. NPDC004368]